MYLDIEILKDLIIELGGEVKFDTPVIVKMTPHSHPIKARSVKYENGEITAYGDISILIDEPTALSNSLIQRLKLIQHESIQRPK